MAGETIRTHAICLAIHPWSQTSHVVTWLTPRGRLATVVRGAERPKSLFLGQYDLNYTCEILYYARAKGDAHALRDCAPIAFRTGLREDYRAVVLSDYMRSLVAEATPSGEDAEAWFDALGEALDALDAAPAEARNAAFFVASLIAFEKRTLTLAGVAPSLAGFDPTKKWMFFSLSEGRFEASDNVENRGENERFLRVSVGVARCLAHPSAEKNLPCLLDTARIIGVFYHFHLDCALETRRTVLGMISQTRTEERQIKR